MESDLPFSVLDLAPICEGGDAARTLRNSLDLAKHAERLGYARLLAGRAPQHAGHRQLGDRRGHRPRRRPAPRRSAWARAASCCPTTRRWSSPSSSARWPRSIPGRIDLGLGRAPGTDPRTARALRRDLEQRATRSPQDVGAAGLPRQPVPGQRVARHPRRRAARSRSGCSARASSAPSWPPTLGLPFAFASHFAPDDLQAALDVYRRRFTPSAPVGSSVCDGCRRLRGGRDRRGSAPAVPATAPPAVRLVNLRRGVFGQVPPPSTTSTRTGRRPRRQGVEHALRYSFVGSPPTVERGLRAFLGATQPTSSSSRRTCPARPRACDRWSWRPRCRDRPGDPFRVATRRSSLRGARGRGSDARPSDGLKLMGLPVATADLYRLRGSAATP